MKRIVGIVGLIVVVLVAFSGCAPGPNALAGQEDPEGEVAGFWSGLWHGIIAPVTFIVSLFSDSVSMYDVYNNGGWYNFGFLFGMVVIFGGGGGGTACSRRR